ncbi:hypothetical protein HYU95_05760 [Candidatus Daviesbacteria bacterium]|nr:hypothetical protein [Candidatus Daviesbacteria bacterium]
MQKGIAPILIIILLAIVALGGYLIYGGQAAKSTPGETTRPNSSGSNLKTYTNTAYRFSFDYPENWTLDTPSLEDKHPENKTLLQVNLSSVPDFKNKALLGNQKDILSVTLNVWEGGLAQWDSFSQNPVPDPISSRTINQISWTVREFTNVSGLPVLEFSTAKDNRLFILTVSPQDSSLINQSDQILSTFKFN